MGSVPDIHFKVSSLWLLLKVTINTINPPNRNDKSERKNKEDNLNLIKINFIYIARLAWSPSAQRRSENQKQQRKINRRLKQSLK
jgi:hypothetical protein